MKKEVSLTFIEIEKWINENKNILIGSIIKRIKQKGNIFYFKLYKGKTLHLIIYLPYFLFLSNSSIRIEKPTPFQMALRKYAEDQRIIGVSQRELDKIVIFELSNGIKIVFEFFSEGNIVILSSEWKVIDAIVKREWKDRTIEKNTDYNFPPLRNVIKKTFQEILEFLKKENKSIIKVLLENFGLNVFYAEEILKKLNIDKDRNSADITQRELDMILKMIEEVRSSNQFYLIERDIVFISSLSSENSRKFEKINDLFESVYNLLERKKAERIKEKEEEKIRKIITSLEENKKRLEEELEKISKTINLIQNNYNLLLEISNKILELRRLNVDWTEIKTIIKKQYKEIVEEIDEHKAALKLNFSGEKIEVGFKNLRDFLNSLFEKRKKIKEKLENLKRRASESIIKKEETQLDIKKTEEKETKHWYEKFRWFISSEGFLVVSGKDAKTNEELIKKYTRDYDLVLHADIHGSPFTVIRNDKKQSIPPQTIYEAAQFTACYSQAWDLGLGIIPVYCVKPNQLVKTNLPKGSFLIRGEKTWLEKIKLRLSIGVLEENNKIRVFAAPPVAARKKTQYIITLVPGNRTSDELVKEIRKHFESILPFEYRGLFEKISDEEIKKLIPFGKGELVKIL